MGAYFAGKSCAKAVFFKELQTEARKEISSAKFSLSPQRLTSRQFVSPKGEAYFFKKLQANIDVDTLFELLEEALNRRAQRSAGLSESFELVMVLRRLGEVAPLQGMEKLLDIKGGEDLMPALFAGWASKDPEAVLKYYDEHNKKFKEREKGWLFKEILREYAHHAPQKAWACLHERKEGCSQYVVTDLYRQFVSALCRSHPDLIPQYAQDKELIGAGNGALELFFAMGEAWGDGILIRGTG